MCRYISDLISSAACGKMILYIYVISDMSSAFRGRDVNTHDSGNFAVMGKIALN